MHEETKEKKPIKSRQKLIKELGTKDRKKERI